ncbi:LiaF transmembrane domain-containing protein [Pseudoduganella sp. OTU4001]|uniref:LiaF transmembrane domain-containing protein n=1 Tax=Pseudoduganella sp. OTU4001 TaxID=3043854 RepID=UPI00313EAD4E
MRRSNRERNTATQMFIGGAVILAGFLFLIDNLGWIDLEMHVHFWPFVIMVMGASTLAQAPRRGSGSAIAGIVMLGFGLLSLLKGMGLIYISWKVIFPIGIIAAGLMMVLRARRRSASSSTVDAMADVDNPDRSAMFCVSEGESSERILDLTAVLGGFQRKVTTQDFRGGDITTVMGGVDLDMRTASLNGTAVVNVFALMGGISIKVPTDWTVELEGTPILGGFDEKTMQPKDASKRLVVRGTAIMGGVEIRN